MTKEQLGAGLETVRLIAGAIRELGRVPSGHLYARVMGSLSLDQYNKVIGILKKAGLVEETAGHELIWKEPKA
jgi:hypothetical protein